MPSETGARSVAEEALSLLRALTRAGVGVAELDEESRYRYVNAPLAALNGRSPEEHVGLALAEVNPWLAPTLVELRERIGGARGPPLAEVVSPTPLREGKRVDHLEYSVVVLPVDPDARGPSAEPDGAATGASEAGRGTWLLTRPVREGPSSASLRMSMLAARVAFYDFDLRGGRLLWSAGLDALFDLPPRTVEEKELWWLERIHPDERARVEARLAAWLGGAPAPARLEYRLRRGDGSWAHVVDQVELVNDGAGRPVRAMAALCDVTTEHDAHAALRRSEMRYRLATLATTDVVYEWELATDRVEWSSLATLGYESYRQFESLAWWEAQIHPDDRGRVVADLQAAVERGDRLWRDTYRFRRKDGSWAEISDRGYLDRDCDGKLTRMVGAMQDVTEQRRAEAEVRRVNAELERRVQERTAELVAANRELEAFSYSVSHDLRAPLRAIDGFTSALREKHAHQLDAESLDWLGRVRNAAARMSTLIDDLLQLSRVTRATLHRVPVELAPLFEEVVSELRRREPHRCVIARIARMPPALGDPALLHLVAQNLLENAWKYTRARPEAHVDVGAERTGDELCVYVRDDGVGFDPAYAHLLFEPFQRLHGAQEYEGSGVGLATVERVVHRHGGRVGAESSPKGTRFWFTLPLP